jgi:hypothetical protein
VNIIWQILGLLLLGYIGWAILKPLAFTDCPAGYVKTFALARPPIACVPGYQP